MTTLIYFPRIISHKIIFGLGSSHMNIYIYVYIYLLPNSVPFSSFLTFLFIRFYGSLFIGRSVGRELKSVITIKKRIERKGCDVE